MSFFEVIVGMAYALFADAPVDVAVIEVGMGGTWDATNVVDARVAVVTPVASTTPSTSAPTCRRSPARRPGSSSPTRSRCSPTRSPARGRPGPAARRGGGGRRARGHRVRRGRAAGRRRRPAGARCRASAASTRRSSCRCSAPTRPRTRSRRWPRSRRSSAPGRPPGRSSRRPCGPRSPNVRSPGRLERVRTSPTVLVDAAHNPAGMAATVDGVQESFDFTRLVGVVGCVHGKDVAGHPRGARGRLRRARRHPEQLVARDAGRRARRRSPSTSSARTGSSVAAACSPRRWTAIELAEAGPDDALGGSGVLVTGSVITAGEARTLLAGRRP